MNVFRQSLILLGVLLCATLLAVFTPLESPPADAETAQVSH
ncbi:hypothetical protein [Shimia sediminis]|nr:hypothetical protein [Shimia sediminis]